MIRFRWTVLIGPLLIIVGLAPLLIGTGLAAATGEALRADHALTSSLGVTIGVVAICLLFVIAYWAGRRRWSAEDEQLDSVTGLPSRHRLWEAADEAAEGAEYEYPAALLIVELERLNEVNLMFGLDHGDAVIASLADRLRAVVGPDDLLARIGGDELGVLRRRCETTSEIHDLIDGIVEAVARPFDIEGFELVIGAHIGAAQTGPSTLDGPALRAHAEEASYRASRSGSGSAVLWTEDPDNAISPALLTRWVRDAVEGDQFVLHHQPIRRLETGEMLATEALLRWRHPEYGVIGPSALLPGLEDSGHIVAVGRWVIDEACRQIRSWQDVHPQRSAPRVFVNISVRQLLHHQFVTELESSLHLHGVAGDRLCFELGHLGEIGNRSAAWATLRECRALGVRLALDNFGHASSSFAMFQRLPLDYIKLDRHLMSARGANNHDDAVARSLIALSRELGCIVIAEGIEDASTMERAQRLGCTVGQGYHLGVPVPGAELTRAASAVTELVASN